MKKTIKPWGSYEILVDEPFTKVKTIIIKPGEAPSYQYHFKRSEIWVIVQGIASIKIDDITKTYSVGDVVKIDKKSKHCASNAGKEDLIFIEVQLGEYFGEDDIVRVDDKYGRL
jgi:mannose-6-phosphate isomerase-like protein (cupin superfamily)